MPRLPAGVIAALLFPAALAAHHSFKAEFDATQPIRLQGIVARVEWVNPHAWIYVDVKEPDGTVTTWAIEGGTPGSLERRGLRKEDLPAGAQIVVGGFRARSGEPTVNGRSITLPDGRTLAMESSVLDPSAARR